MPSPDRSALDVGDRLPELRLPPIDRTTLALFAGASGDHNPIHIDLDFARRAGMPDVFAQGMLSMAYLGRLLSDWAPPERIREFSTRFVSITPLRAVVTCTGSVSEVATVAGKRFARITLKAALQDGVVTLSGEALVQLD